MANLKFPTVNQIVATAMCIVVIGFVVKMLPANIQSFFRI